MAKEKTLFEVIVGNIGTVYSGFSKFEAKKKHKEYVAQSQSGVGRAAGEPVTMMADAEPILEYDPSEVKEANTPLMLKDCSQNDVVVVGDTPMIVWTTDEIECVVLAITQRGSGTSAGTVSLPLTTVVKRIWQRK